MKLKPFPKFMLIAIVVGALIFGLSQLSKNGVSNPAKLFKGKLQPVRVCVVTWGGYAGGEYFNRGFKSSAESMYMKEYGLPVEFVLMDDYAASRAAFKADQVDLLWTTADSYSTELAAMASYNPKVAFQADWSRGGDVMPVVRDIKTFNDLRGRTIAVAYGTPSHSFLLNALDAAGLTDKDVKLVQVASAVDAAAMFKAGQVDAAVVWSPDDADCLKNVAGSHVLKSTRDAPFIIADVFYAKEAWIASHQKELKSLIEGWMRGAAEINSNPQAKEAAAVILSRDMNQPLDFCRQAINNVRLCTLGDNSNFFDLQGNYSGVKGEDLYLSTGRLYATIGLAPSVLPAWRSVTDLSILRTITLTGPEHMAEVAPRFTKATPAMAEAPAFASKQLTVTFATGSAVLDENAKTLIDRGFVDVAKRFGNARIRIEGNTDSTGDYNANVSLSRRRAQAVADYLISLGFDSNRFVVVGNGPDKPVADNNSDAGRAKNRRTDFELLSSN